MRLKNPGDGPLVVHNGNENILSSNRQFNDNTNSLTGSDTTNYGDTTHHNLQDTLQWCNTINSIQHQQNENQQNLNKTLQQQIKQPVRPLYNINNNLASSLRVPLPPHRGTASSLCSESSPDDSLLDYEDAHQSCSSVDTTPQDEDRGFDLSDSESLSDDGNLSGDNTRTRGIVNPNYPGFQHLAHTLDYSIKACSDTDFTDDDLDLDVNTKINDNNINNNNEDLEYKIDSVNRLDSVENIQKVFYDKPKLNIPLEPLERDPEKRSNLDEEGSSHTTSDEDFENLQDISDPESNQEEKKEIINIVGDFGKEIEREFGRIERGIEQDLEEAVEKLSVANDLSPSALKYNIEPNTEQPFEKSSAVKIQTVELLEPVTVQQKIEGFLNSVPNEYYCTEPQLEQKLPLQEKVEGFLNSFDENFPIFEPPQIKINAKDIPHPVTYFQEVEQFLENNQDIFSKTEILEPVNIVLETPQYPETVNIEEDANQVENREVVTPENPNKADIKAKTTDALLSNAQDVIKNLEKMECEVFCKENKTKNENEKDEDSMVPRKKEKIDFVKKRRNSSQMMGSLITVPRRDLGGKNKENAMNRRSLPPPREKKRPSPEVLGGFDVYNIETAMPKIDLDAIESHLKAAREEERRRRTDREEIRRRLAMGSEDDYYTGNDRPGRKPSLQARLQSGMNLQICFMNETASDTDSPNSDSEYPVAKPSTPPVKPAKVQPIQQPKSRPVSLPLGNPPPLLAPLTQPMTEADFFARQARLQTEARMALAQAKEMAHMQMEIERQRQKKSPITEMVRSSLEKVGIPFPEERRRVSRQILTEMNVAQLQVIVNDLHTQIETLNENLVQFLMNRDDLHMEQDSMLVDIEDLTRYLGAKEQSVKEQKIISNNNIPPPSPAPASPLLVINNSVKPRLHRIASLVKK